MYKHRASWRKYILWPVHPQPNFWTRGWESQDYYARERGVPWSSLSLLSLPEYLWRWHCVLTGVIEMSSTLAGKCLHSSYQCDPKESCALWLWWQPSQCGHCQYPASPWVSVRETNERATRGITYFLDSKLISVFSKVNRIFIQPVMGSSSSKVEPGLTAWQPEVFGGKKGAALWDNV